MKTLCPILLLVLAARPAAAGYFQQASFAVTASTVAGLDSDSVGNLYLLGQTAGAASFRVTSYATPGMSPLFSFDTGFSSPSAFAVEPSGIIDVLDSSNGFTLRRYTNPGTLVGQSTYSLSGVTPNMVTTAIDKANARLYIAYQYTYHPIYPQCLGCGGPSTVTKATINQYDLRGNLLAVFSMPGADYTAGSCYTPTAMAADNQGNLFVADANCQQVLKFSPSGAVATSARATWSYQFNPRALWTDAAGYVYVSQAVCGATGCPWGVVKLGGDGSFVTSFAADSSVGAAWDSRILYMSSSGSQPVRRFVFDGAPSVPAEATPLGAAVQHSSAAALSWQQSSDSDGDPVTYSVYLGTTPTQLTFLGATTQPSFATQPLAFGATYYWQIVAQDTYLGLPLQNTQAPVVSFNLGLSNQPPQTPVYLTTATAYGLHQAAPALTLAWQASSDPDGDPVSYTLLLASGAAASRYGLGAATAFTLPVVYGTTYTWQVIASDPYGAASTAAARSFSVGFANQAPAVPPNLSPSGVVPFHGYAPSAAFSWGPSLDPDGDPVTYALALGTSAAAMSPVPGAAPGYTAADLALGVAYYYRITAVDSYGAVSTSPVNQLLFQLANAAPASFGVSAGSGTVVTRATEQTLGWTAAVDPDGDAVTYGVFLGTSPSALGLAATTPSSTASVGPLAFGTTYYWRVDAYDGFGGTTTVRGGAQPLTHVFANSAPSALAYLNAPASVSVHATSPSFAFAWAAASDPDGDPVSYELDLSTGGAYSAVSVGTATAAALPLAFETPYQWRVQAADPFGGVSTGSWTPLIVHLANQPPAAIQYQTAASVSTRAAVYPISWADSGDPDGDPVLYRFEVGSASAAMAVVQIATATSYSLPLSFGATTYYRVTAIDPFGAATTGQTRTFCPVFLNQAPQQPSVVGPFNGSPLVKTMKNAVSVTWDQVSDPQGDPITYTVYFGPTVSGMSPLATIAQNGPGALALKPLGVGPQATVQSDANTVTLTLTGLDFYKTYFLRVTASNPYGATAAAPTQSFTLAAADGFPKAYNYPNPFSPNRGGTSIVFNAPATGYAKATVEVYSELQDLLFKQDYFNIPPGISQVRFDGHDRGGRALYNGSYICRVRFSGPDDKEVFYLLVVK